MKKIASINLALACLIPSASVFAAAMDRSGQSISAFLQPNNYAEAGISILDADVSGRENAPGYNRKIDDMADSYVFANAAVKAQVNDRFSVGLIYDQPLGAKATYNGDNFLVSDRGTDQILAPSRIPDMINTAFNRLTPQERVGAALKAQGVDLTSPQGQAQFEGTLKAYNADPTVKESIDKGVHAGLTATVNGVISLANQNLGLGGTHVDVNTHNFALMVGFKPVDNITLYAAPVYQTVKGTLSLRGNVASVFNGYDATFKETGDIGWLAGAAFEIPEIALKTSLTYRSKISHDVETVENLSSAAQIRLLFPTLDLSPGITKVKTPQSVNLDFQTGIMENTVAFANFRWVDWNSFGIRPHTFGKISEVVGPQLGRPNGFDIIAYTKDQWSVNAGVGRKLNDHWAGTLSAGWDSGAGNPVSSLGPTKGYTNVGIGLQYSPTPAYFVAGGVKYFWLGDVDAQISSQAGTSDSVAKFEDNTAIAYGLKMGYRF